MEALATISLKGLNMSLERSDNFKPDRSSEDIMVAAGQPISLALRSLDIQLPRAAIALVNGKTCDLSYLLQPGDQVHFLFQISGGSNLPL